MSPSSHHASSDADDAVESLGNRITWTRTPPFREFSGDLGTSVAAALRSPINFPAIEQAIIPGDRLVVAVDAGVPELIEVALAIVDHLAKSDPQSIDVVLSGCASDDLMMDLAAALQGKANSSRHQCNLRDSLMYLAADEAGDPVYLNRMIVDADFVLPVMPGAHDRSVTGRRGADWFHLFADSATQRRRYDQSMLASSEMSAIERTLGVQVLMSVFPAMDGRFAGCEISPPMASSTGSQGTTTKPDALLVVLDGDDCQQSWLNLARAAQAVMPHVHEDSTVIFWTRIRRRPPGTLLQTSRAGAAESAEVSHAEEEFPPPPEDEAIARVLARIIGECRVVLRSEIDNDLVEELGMGVMKSVEQLQILAEADHRWGVVRAAAFLGPRALQAPTGNS